MASKYEAHTWKKADIVTTDLFNHIEQGVETNAKDIDSLSQGTETLSSRMDTVISVAEGEITPADAELIDVRVAYGGDVYPSAGDAVRSVGQDLYELKSDLTDIVGRNIPNGFVVDGNKLYLAIDGNTIGDPIDLPEGGGGGGGGGSTNNAVITATNTTGWISKTVSSGSACSVSIDWSSLENEIPTGNGSLRVIVNNSIKAIMDVKQGGVTVDVTKYLTTGTNSVRLNISDVYGNSRTLSFSVNVVEVSITSSFDSSTIYTDDIKFTYIPNGKVDKTVHFIIDNKEVGTQQATSSGRQLTYTISGLIHGTHSLNVYFDCEIDGSSVKSNELYYEIVFVVEGEDTPVIASNFNQNEVDQYSSAVIKYTVYTPGSLNSIVTLYANGEEVSSQTVDRTTQTWSYKAITTGKNVLKIVSGNVEKQITFTVNPVEIDVHPTTDSLELYLTSYGRSNNETHPEVWDYNDIHAELTGFNFTSDGWQLDDDNNTALRVSGDARVTIPLKMFANDFRTTGKTIEIEFKTSNVRNYDATILSCMDSNRGISLTAQKAMLKSEQSEISTQYKEDEHVRIGFVVEKKSDHRLIFIYINGIMSGVVRYPENDDFSQITPADIAIGSNDCTTDIYCIRVYDNNLTRQQMLDNWIADTQNSEDMLYRYHHNDVYDDYGNIVISKLPSDLPYMIIHCEQLPQYKGDKKTVSITYVDPVDNSKSFTADGVQADVQGTSSQYYARKNYKLKYKNGFNMTKSGKSIEAYPLRTDAIPTKTFTMKADVASSEGANNVELVRLYNNACPYKTPAQVADERVRQGIDGFPIVMFWDNGNETTFLGKYNWNNDKGTEEVFGFSGTDESWEIKNNTSNRVLWKSDDYTSTTEDEYGNIIPAWINDFESRYPEDYVDYSQLKDFATWAKSTDQSQATGNSLPQPVTYGDITYTNDTAEYRLAKFKAEAGDYMELDSAIFYYLFTELFLMVDSRAKNAFPSFIGSTIGG